MSKPDFNRIFEHYRRHTLAIYEAGKSDWGIDVNAWDFEAGIELSVIETALWSEIRCVGVVMYPQYPVAGYFVDFGNPVARVAIECDGKAWHEDKAKDAERQTEIEDNGWVVYRISGADCLKESDYDEDEFGQERIVMSPACKLIKDIAELHGIRFNPPKEGRWLDRNIMIPTHLRRIK